MATSKDSNDIWERCNFKQEDAFLEKILKRKNPPPQVSEPEGANESGFTEYLNQQPDFVKSVVVLIEMWAASSIPAAERLKAKRSFETLAQLIGIHGAKTEMAAVANKVHNCESSLMRALIRCLETFSKDVHAVTVFFENMDLHSSSLGSSELEETKERSGIILDPTNLRPRNYVETYEGQCAWSLLQATAARYFEYVRDVKSGLWPECVNGMCENIIDGRVQKIVRRTDGKAYVVLPRLREPSFCSMKLMILAVAVLIVGLIYRIYSY